MNVTKNVPLFCDLCSKEFSGVLPAQQHFISEAHRRKEDQKKNSVFQSGTKHLWCGPCNLQCNSAEQFEQHIASPRHNEIVRRAFHIPSAVRTPATASPQASTSGRSKEYDFDGNRGYCHLCNLDLTSPQHARQHLSGSKHQKKQKQSEEGEEGLLSCSICRVPFSCTKNAQEHLASAKHMKKKMELEQQEKYAGGNVNLGLQNVGQIYPPSVGAQIPQFYPQSHLLADVPVYSNKSAPEPRAKVVDSTPLTSSITLLGASVPEKDFGASKEQISNFKVPFTFDGKQGYCNICQVDFTSPQNAQQHLDGSKHQKAEKLWKQGGASSQKTTCDVCNVVFSGPECAQQHYASDKHKKRSQLPATNFTVLEPEKPALPQKVNLSQTTNVIPHANVQPDLPLNIQPDSTKILTGRTPDSVFTMSEPLSNVMLMNFAHSGTQLSSPHIAQSEDPGLSEGLCLSVQGGSLPIPLAVGGLDHYQNIPNSINSRLVLPNISGNNLDSFPSKELIYTRNTKVEDDKEYHFDGSRGWCNVCNIELTSRQHAEQHLSGKNHSKSRGRWMSSHRDSNSPASGNIDMQNARGADINVNQTANRPFRFDGNRGWCNVCNIELTSSQHASQHLAGKSHAKALARYSSANIAQGNSAGENVEGATGAGQPYEFNGMRGFCHVCKIELTSEAHARQHLSGNPHRKAILRWNSVGVSGQTEQSSQASDQGETIEEPPYVFNGTRGRCFVCDIELTSREHASQHLSGRNHARAEERKKMVKQNGLYLLECKVCLKSFSGQESATQHYASAKHRNKSGIRNGGLSCSALALDQTGIVPDGRNSPNIIISRGQSSPNISLYMCEVCNCPLNSFEQLSIHKKSPNHLKTVEKMNRYIEVTTTAEAERRNTLSVDASEGCEGSQTVEKKEEYTDLWNALRTGEITTVKTVVTNVEPGEISSSIYNWNGNLPITRSQNVEVVVTSGQQGTTETTHSSSAVVRSAVTSSSGNGEVSSGNSTRTDMPPRRSSTGFDPVAGSTLTTSASPGSGGMATTMVTPVITTDALPVRRRTGMMEVNTSDSLFLSSQSDDNDTSEGRIRSGTAMKQVAHNPLRNQNSTRHRGNKVTIDSFEDLDSEEETPIYRNVGQGDGLPETDNDSYISFNSHASSRLNDGPHASLTTDNNPSVATATRQAGNRSLLSDAESGIYPSSVDLISGFSGIGPLPKEPVENPYKDHFKYYCPVCKRPMNTKKDWESHLESQRHQQRAAAVHAPLRKDLGQICRNLGLDEALEEAYTVTSTIPRSYQVELFCKTMEDDRVIFLPTGTGKTLVSVMTLSSMLRLNPKRPVMFLVDKVLLVLQQSKYIIREIGEKMYKRLPLQDGSYPDLQERTLKIATLCGNVLPADSTPLYRHDVIVTTAAYADNLLQKEFIRWTDFSLVVFDEAHHCVKKHPFNRLLEGYHRPCRPEVRPKVLGLTASPAGRDSVENTYIMLQELFTNLGGAKVAIVQTQSELEELNKYQSNAQLVINFKPYSEEEREFRSKLQEYLCYCYRKLAGMSNLVSECDWGLEKLRRPEDLAEFASKLNNSNLNGFLLALDSLKPVSHEPTLKANLDFLIKHSKIVVLALSDMDGCGIPVAVADLQTQAISQPGSGFNHAKTLGLPSAPVEEAVRISSHAAQVQQEFQDNPLYISLYTQLLETLNSMKYINWKNKDPMALILVRERAHAHKLSNFLKQTHFAAENDLKVTSVVGHGSGAADGGMKVKQQKRVLDGVKKKKFNIIVATSVAEEGVDIPECELVVCMNPPSTVTGLVQMRGRARKKGSFFVILCKSRDEEDQMKSLLKREEFMMKAAKLCIEKEEREQ